MIEIKSKIIGQSVNKISSTSSEQPEIKKEILKLKRPRVLPAEVYKIKSLEEHALYLTIVDIEQEGKIYPFEIFFNTKNPLHNMWTNALTITLSTLFRQAITSDINIINVIENLKEVLSTNGGYWQQNVEKPQYMGSIVAEVAYCIEEHLNKISNKNLNSTIVAKLCPKCGEISLVREAGCDICKSCDYSKCG
jgi:ribonucleoside-diphosphate reductase alpha chain